MEKISLKDIEKVIQEGKKKGYICEKLQNLFNQFEKF